MALTTFDPSQLNIGDTRVLQTVTGHTLTNDSTTSATFVDTSTAIVITPQKSTSKFLIFISGLGTTGNGATTNGIFTISGTTSGNLGSSSQGLAQVIGNSATSFYNQMMIMAADSPGTTATQTYKVRFYSAGGAAVAWGVGQQVAWTIMEIG